jgi:hypothetical protein
MGSGDINGDLWPSTPFIDRYIDDLSGKVDGLSGVSRLIAESLVQNKNTIVNLKRITLLEHITDPGFIPKMVIPLIISHLALYETDKLRAAMLEKVDKNVGSAYFDTWKQSLEQFVGNNFYNELVADVVGYMLTDKGDMAKDWGDTYKDFTNMLLLLKQNGLAYVQPNTV